MIEFILCQKDKNENSFFSRITHRRIDHQCQKLNIIFFTSYHNTDKSNHQLTTFKAKYSLLIFVNIRTSSLASLFSEFKQQLLIVLRALDYSKLIGNQVREKLSWKTKMSWSMNY